MIVKKNNKIILAGNRSCSGDKLCDIHLPQQEHHNHIISCPSPTKHSINIILRVDKRAHDLATYLHASCFSPSKSTFMKAIQLNFLLLWPGGTTHLIKKHTELGQIKTERQCLRSTKPTKTYDSIYNNIHGSNRALPS